MELSIYDDAPVNSVQSRIERGIVFEMGDTRTVANGGNTVEYFAITGNKLVIIESRQIITNGSNLTYRGFKNPVISARGDKLPVVPRNGFQTEMPEMILYHGPTVVSTGAGFPPLYLPGADGVGQRAIGQFNQSGFVRIIEPNTQYVLRITNDGATNPATVQYYLLWSEITLK